MVNSITFIQKYNIVHIKINFVDIYLKSWTFLAKFLASPLTKSSVTDFHFRRVMKGHEVGEYVQKNAPAFCQVNVVGEEGKKIKKGQVVQLKGNCNPPSLVHSQNQPEIAKQSSRNLFEWMCFSPKFYGDVGKK